jgi:hypothetical protein
MRKFLEIVFISILLQSCDSCGNKGHSITLRYQNIVILSDMSDRILPKINGSIINQQYPHKDTSEIHEVINYFRNECVKPGEKIGDRSSISFSTFSNANIARIDIGQFTNIGDKQQFINSTGNFEHNGLDFRLHEFENQVHNAYLKIRNPGLDLISALMEKIENEDILKFDTLQIIGKDTTFITFDNHIYIFTDGYLEYSRIGGSNPYYFGESEIQKLRDFCKINHVSPTEALENNSNLGIQPSFNEKNKLIKLHVFETHSRDWNVAKMSWANDPGVRDNEILEAVWKKWAKESGFIQPIDWRPY